MSNYHYARLTLGPIILLTVIICGYVSLWEYVRDAPPTTWVFWAQVVMWGVVYLVLTAYARRYTTYELQYRTEATLARHHAALDEQLLRLLKKLSRVAAWSDLDTQFSQLSLTATDGDVYTNLAYLDVRGEFKGDRYPHPTTPGPGQPDARLKLEDLTLDSKVQVLLLLQQLTRSTSN